MNTYPLFFLLALALSVGCNRAAPTGPGATKDGTNEPLDFTAVALDGGSPSDGADAGAANAHATGNDAGPATPEPLADAGGAASSPAEPSCDCPEGYSVTADADACEKNLTVDATNEGMSYEICQAPANFNYGKFGARYPDGTKIQNDYWGRDDGNEQGRLNEVGIWPCNETTGTAGFEPTGEWIGFTHCIELNSKRDYIVGIGGDNRVRLKLNGEVIFEDVSDATSAFNYWWLSALEIESGVNIIEMQGYNVSLQASFGAEIAGPFEPNSLGSDEAMIAADYANNIVWSTGTLVGQSFQVGEDSGWTCPEGYTLNVCTATPECTGVDVVPCGGTSESPGLDGGL